jgi:hypothetical protein
VPNAVNVIRESNLAGCVTLSAYTSQSKISFTYKREHHHLSFLVSAGCVLFGWLAVAEGMVYAAALF